MKHGRSCKKGKKCLTEALPKARELYYHKKAHLARKDDLEKIGNFIPMDSQCSNGIELGFCMGKPMGVLVLTPTHTHRVSISMDKVPIKDIPMGSALIA